MRIEFTFLAVTLLDFSAYSNGKYYDNTLW